MPPTPPALIDAISGVIDPTFDRSIKELGTLEEVRLEGDRVFVRLALSTPSSRVREQIAQQIRKAVAHQGVDDVELDTQVRVPTRDPAGDDPLPGVRNVIVVMSGKGGVGKSSVATNLALCLQRAGARVGLLDADIYGPSIPTMLGIEGHPSSKDGKKISPLERFGLKLMSIGFLLEDPKAAIIWRGPMLHGALQQFLTDVDWGELDYLVLDLPPGTGDVALTLAQKLQITGAVIVTTPQEVALQDVYKNVSMCLKLNLPVLGVVENMSYFIDSAGVRHELFGSGGGQKVADYAQTRLLGQVPIDPLVREWADKGTPVVQGAPASEAAKALAAISDDLATEIAVQHFKRRSLSGAPRPTPHTRLRIVR